VGVAAPSKGRPMEEYRSNAMQIDVVSVRDFLHL
jgi:hypothetical protein